MHRRLALSLAAVLVIGACTDQQPTGTSDEAALAVSGAKPINVVLKGKPTKAQLAELAKYGTILKEIPQLNAVIMTGPQSSLSAIRSRPYVKGANFDIEKNIPPFATVQVSDFTDGLNTWDLDAVNVTSTPFSSTRVIAEDGSGVYVAILDTGLLQTWRSYFPEERIAVQYARSLGGGGNDRGNVSEQPNKWEQDTHSHGTHVTSTVIGYSFFGTAINGVAPKATIIPVKVLNQNGSGWSSVIAAGIVYIADLKAGPLAGHSVVINMSLGGPVLEAVEQAALDYAISRGVIIVASAGNNAEGGMGFPGAYPPVISVGASGWVREWLTCGGSAFSTNWWVQCDVAEPTSAADFYITDFSSRALAGQDLDVAAPGSWVVGPFQLNQGQLSYFFLGGTSMASPHVAGIVALMAQKTPGLTAAQAEATLESTAIPLPPGSRDIFDPNVGPVTVSWGSDATGAGLATADAALGLNTAKRPRGKK
ncbi:MAG: S8 family peptidase [bacterium]